MRLRSLSLFVALVGCNLDDIDLLTPPHDSPDCASEGGAITLEVNPSFYVTPTSGTLRIAGTARHARGLTIRRVIVGGKEATSTSFNYSTWSADLSAEDIARVAASADAGSQAQVVIPIVAFDVCDPGAPRGTARFTTSVQAALVTRVRQLSLVRNPVSALPGFAPLDAEVQVELRSNLEAAGAEVGLTLDPGTAGARFANGTATATAALTPADNNTAMGRVALTARTAGVATISATAGPVSTQFAVRFVGPPTLVPGSQTVIPGQRVVVTALSEASIAACELTPANSTAFSVEGFDTSGQTTVNGTRAEFRFTRTTMAGPGMTVTCRDAFGQTARSVIEAGAAP